MENQLAVIVQESGLEASKAQFILEKFQGYFAIAAEWEVTAKTIIVTDEKQTDKMDMARTGRLILREKRIAVEKARKELKEQALREGKAIDGIANVLKALIVPIEEHLERQEKFVELKKAAEDEVRRQEVERRMEEERIAAEKAAAEEQERIRKENERLKAEAIAKEQAAAKEREEHARILAEQQKKADAERKALEDKARKEREAAEAAARVEREKQAKALAEQRAIAEAQQKKADAEAKAKIETERKEKERLAEILASQVECPNCHHKFNVK